MSDYSEIKEILDSLNHNLPNYDLLQTANLINEQTKQTKLFANELLLQPISSQAYLIRNMLPKYTEVYEIVQKQAEIENNFRNILQSTSISTLNAGNCCNFSELTSFIQRKNELEKSFLHFPIQTNETLKLRNQLTHCNTSFDFIKELNKEYFSYEDVYPDSYRELSKNIKDEDIVLENKELVIKSNNDTTYNYCNQKDVIELPQIIPSISEEEAENFVSFLKKYPMMGMSNPIGLKLYDGLKKLITERKKILNENCILYRSRPWTEGRDITYTTEQMWQPPSGITKMERFNPSGVSYLYMANSIETSKAEIDNVPKYTLMEVKTKHNLSYLDISESNCYIFQLCNKKRDETDCNPTEYLLPNFIAQCLFYMKEFENIDIDGIKYKSIKNPNDYCYVFFGITQYDFRDIKLIKK